MANLFVYSFCIMLYCSSFCAEQMVELSSFEDGTAVVYCTKDFDADRSMFYESEWRGLDKSNDIDRKITLLGVYAYKKEQQSSASKRFNAFCATVEQDFIKKGTFNDAMQQVAQLNPMITTWALYAYCKDYSTNKEDALHVAGSQEEVNARSIADDVSTFQLDVPGAQASENLILILIQFKQ